MAVLEELEAELATENRPALPGMVGGVSRGAVGRRRKKKRNALDEVTEEIAAEPESERPMGALEQVRLETETDPENVRRMRAEGKRLTDEQQKIAFTAERERPLTDVLVGAAKAYYPAVWNTIGQLAKGTAKFAVEGVGKPLGNAVLSGLMYEPGSDEQEKAMRESLGGAYDATRSLASGVAQDIEETSNAAIRAGMFGTSITDLAAEKSGLISEDQAFNNYLSREEMRRGEAEDAQAYPDRASTLMARNPLAGTVINSASVLSGQGDLTPEAKRAAVKDFEQTMLQQASEFTPDEDLSLIGEVLSPVGLPSRAVMPLTKALGGAMEATGGAAVRAVTKPTIGGVNPLEGVGIGIRKVGEGADAAGAKFSEAITGRPDTFLASPATVVSAFTKRPGQLVEGSGKFLRDIGRQIDEGGIRGRTGIIERLGQDPNSSAWVQDLFGAGSQKKLDRLARKNKKRIEAGKEAFKPGRGGIMRAKTADYGLRMANSLSKTGVSGSVLNGILGAADIETAEEFGRSTGVGFGIGTYMGARVPERIGAVLDPTLNLRSKIDRVVETDPLDRRLDEEADRKRFRATEDPKIVRMAETIASPDELIALRLKELDGLFQMKAESEYAEEDTTELDGRITSMVDGINRLREQTKNLSQADLDERRRMIELDIIDNLDVLRSNHSVAGLNNVDVNLLRGDEMAGWLRDKWGQTLERAEAVVGQFDGAADLSDAENQTLMLARETVNAFNAELLALTGSSTTAPTRGVAFDPRESAAAHLVRANVTVPTIVINADAAMRDPRGFRHTMLHEGNHALRQFKEVREMQQPMYERLFGKKAGIPDDQGNRQQITPGIITDEFIDNILTPLYFGDAPTMNFESVEARREYIREEVVSEISGISEGGARTIREVLDSPGQAVVDRLLISRQNSILGRLRAALELAGVELDSLGNVKSVLFGQSVSNASMPEVLAMMRQFKRQQLEYTDTMVFASKEMRDNVEIGLTELMTNRALQEAYKDDVNWQHEVILDVRDENGDSVVQIPLPESPVTDAAVGEYRIVNGQLVDENGTVLPIDSSVNLTGLPDNSRASVENRIARNVDGSPKIIQQKEIEARARQRDQMIKDAIDNAPDDGSPTRLRDTGNGYYVGIPSPSQLSAIRELPNTLVTPYVKKNLLAFIEVMQRRDGSRILMEYQPALKKGKYRALSPKIRDVVPIGFRFTKAGNWLAVNVSVSRMFDKLDLWARNKPENLDLWGRSPARFMDDVLRVLDNHNKNLAGQTNLDIDPDIALQKKNRVNDFFNMFTKDTEAANPSRTKLKARRGQESADRILMSARIDRINQMQISNAQKFPVDYGKMKINFLPGQPNGELRLDPSEDLEVENDLGLEVGPGARFLPGIRYTDLPDDPKKLMVDFYLLNAMLTTPPTGWSMGKFGGEATMYAPSADPTGRYAGVRAEKYQDALDEAKQTLIPALHSKIQKALYFSIGAEFRHIFDMVRSESIPQDLVDSPFYQEYAKEYAIQGTQIFGLKKEPAPERYKDESKGYQASFVAMETARKKLGMSIADVARFAERMYREPKWSSSYGGPKWAEIATHLAQMSEPAYSTERVRAVVTDPETGRMQIAETDEFRDPGVYSQMFQEIDRAYDLQHNTNTVFNKIKKYSLGSEGYGWIAKMLDFKANIGNPRELQRYASGTMRNLSRAWLGDMRADAPLTQDLEESVKAQLPENFKDVALDPDQFIEVLKDLVGSYYRKSSSGVRRENPYENIANAAEGIHRNLGRGSDAWKAIKKDQNAHIGLILQDHFGDIGIAQTDAVKLFRMLLNEGTDPRVTGKPAIRTPLNVPKPEKPFPDITTSTLKAAAQSIINGYLTNPGKNEGVVLGNHNLFLEVNQANEFVLMAQPFLSGTFGSPFVIKWLKVPADVASKPIARVKIQSAITEFGNDLNKGVTMPTSAPSALTEPVFKVTTQMVNFAAGSNVIGDGSGKGEWMMKLAAKNPAYSTLSLYKNGLKFKSYNVAISESSKKPLMGSVELATEMINKDIVLNTPQQASGTSISPGDLLSIDKIKTTADKIVANWDTKAMGSSVDILGHRFYLAPTGTSNPGFADLTVRKKNASGPAFGPPTIIKTILMSNSSAKQVANAIQEFQDWLGTAPAEYSKSGGVVKTPSGQWFIGNVFQPKLDKSTPSNLNEFVTGLLFNGFNGLKLGDVTVVLAGGSGKATTFNVYQGDSVSESNLLTVATIPGGKKRDIVDWFAGFAEMQAKKQGYFTAADWMQQNLKMMLETNPMPKESKTVAKIIDGLPGFAKLNVNQLLKDLGDIEWVDTNLANLPPSDVDASADFVESLLLKNATGLAKIEIMNAISGPNDIATLGKYLYDVGKWASDKLEKRIEAGMTEEFDYKGLTPDSPATGYPKSDGTLKTIAEVAAAVGPIEAGSNENHVYFITNGGTSIQNPYEDETGEAIALPNEIAKDADIAKGQIMSFWSYQGIGPSEVETALAIFDAANPGHLYSKPASGKTYSMDSIMEKANELGVLVYDVSYDGQAMPQTIMLGDEDNGVTIKKNGPQSNDYTFQGDDQNFAIGDLDTVLKAAAKYLKKSKPVLDFLAKSDSEKQAQKQAMEFLDTMLLDDPIELGGNTWELEIVEEDNDGNVIGAVVKLNGVAVSNTIPIDPEVVAPKVGNKAIYDDYFALDWMKEWKAPEAKSLLTPEQDQMMVAASELVAALSGGYIAQPEVTVGGKNFSAKINEQGNMVVFGQDESGNLTGAIPITGSKNMDPIDLEAAVYEALDLLNANAAPYQPPKITPQAINEAAEALMNDETTSLGKYTFEPIASGLGGTRVNIFIGDVADAVSYFLLDTGEYRDMSDMLDAFHDKITEFLENNPEFDDGSGGTGPSAKYMPAWSADQLAERPEITAVPEEFDERPLRPRFVYRLESIEDDPRRHELTDADGFTFFTTSPESAAALALNFAYDGYRPTSENFSVYRYRLPENADIQRDHTLFNLDKMTSGQERVAAVRNAHEAMGLPLDAYRYVPAGEVAGTFGKRIDFPENSDLMKIYRAIRRGGRMGGVQFMPGQGITPKTLYNFYHLATLESQGRIKSEYGQGLMREYLGIYKKKYLDTLGPLVADQIKKYIGRGRVDEGVTDDVLEAAANNPTTLDELMRQTYRSDMKRRNDVWNNITEHLKGLAEARTPRDIIFRIDRLNNAIHNTNELLFTKFKNAGELMNAFEAINDARDERAYGRMVDKDLRNIEEFEGGSGARLMPAASKAAIVDRIVEGVKPEDRLKGESAWFTPKGWVNVSDHLDIFPEDLAELRKVNYDDLKDRNFVRVRKMGKTLWYEGRPTRKMLKELKDTAVERRLKLEEDPVESYRNSARFMPGGPIRAAAIQIGDRVFEGPMHMMVMETAWKDPAIQEMFASEEDFEDAMMDVDRKDMMDSTSLSFGEEPNANPPLKKLPAGVPPVTFGFVDQDGKFHDRRKAMEIVYGDYQRMGLDSQPLGPLFTEDLPTPLPGSGARFMPGAVEVPTQRVLDRLKERLPRYEVEVEGPDEKLDMVVRVLLPKGVRRRGGQDLMSKAYGSRVVGTALIQLGPENQADAIEVFGSSVFPPYRGKGYGQALYREVAKIAQKNKKKFIYGSSVSEDAARVRGRLFREEETKTGFSGLRKGVKGPWQERGDVMLSRVGPSIRYMPGNASGSSQVDQSLAGVTGPDTDQGPLSGARFMPGYNPRYTDDDGNFDFGLYSEDKRKTIAYLRDRMGITRKDFPTEEEWKRTIRETMRDVVRGS
jgi:GNAT superfamily N-acetyltransferase